MNPDMGYHSKVNQVQFVFFFQKSHFHLDSPRATEILFSSPLVKLFILVLLPRATACKNWIFFIKNKQEFSTIIPCFSLRIKPGEDCYFTLADIALSNLVWWQEGWKKVNFGVPSDPSHSMILLRIRELTHHIHSCLLLCQSIFWHCVFYEAC